VIDRDAWRPIAEWLAARSIFAPVRGAAAFREHVVDIMAMNAIWRFHHHTNSLADILKIQGESGWMSFLPEASCDDVASEAWAAMRNRLMFALIDLECLPENERPR